MTPSLEESIFPLITEPSFVVIVSAKAVVADNAITQSAKVAAESENERRIVLVIEDKNNRFFIFWVVWSSFEKNKCKKTDPVKRAMVSSTTTKFGLYFGQFLRKERKNAVLMPVSFMRIEGDKPYVTPVLREFRK